MGKIVEISEAQALDLVNETFAPDSYFNPIQDKNDKWVVSEEEVDQLRPDKAELQYLKSLTKKVHQKKDESI